MNPLESDFTKLYDLYPDVESLTLFVAFDEADKESEPNFQQIIFTGESSTAFFIDCSREDCVEGGFDYAPFIEELIRSGEQMAKGKIACQGSLERGSKNICCALQSEFRLIVRRKP